MFKKKNEIFDIFLLILFPVLSVIISLLFKTSYLISILLFYGLPALWLSMRHSKKIKKVVIFSFLTTVPMGLMMDYIGTLNQSWFVPNSLLSFRFFNLIPFEDFVWFFVITYAIVIFYESFFNKDNRVRNKNVVKFVLVVFFILLIFFIILFFKSNLFIFSNAYLWLAIFFFVVPTIFFVFLVDRKIMRKFLITAFYFFMITIIFEAVALNLEQWIFPGEYMFPTFNLAGCRFPFEELFFVAIGGPFFALFFYEFLVDDKK